MKKILTSLLALFASCAVLTACGGGNNAGTSSTPEASVPSSSIPEDSTVTDPHQEAMDLARDFVYGSLVDKDIEVSKDYTLIKTFYSGILDEELTITWTVDVTEGVTLVEGETEWTVEVKPATEDIFYTLTATLTDGDGHTSTFTLDRKVKKADQEVAEKITEAPVEGEAYKLYMYQEQKKNDLYFIGKMSGFYLGTNNASKGEGYEVSVDVFVEKVAGKDAYYLTFTYEGVKKYIGVANNWSNGSYHDNAIIAETTEVKADECKTFEFVWNNELKTLVATLDGVKSGKVEDTTETRTDTFFLGTSGSYYTFGAMSVSEAEGAYVGCLVKMVNKAEVSAEDKVASEKATLSVTTAFSGAVNEKLPTQGTTYGDVTIAWAVKSGDATITNNVLTAANPAADATIVLTATITCGTVSDTVDVEITVYPKSPVTQVTEVKEGEAYTVYMYQASKAKNYYLTGAMDGKYLATTDDITKAAKVYIENVDGGFKVYVMDANGAKSYITLEAFQADGKNYISASVSFSTEGSVFTYNSQFLTLCSKQVLASDTSKSDTFFLGTYGTYTTISASGSYYMTADKLGTEQFYATFGIIDESAITPPEGGEEPEVPELKTPEQIVNALYALADGESLTGPFTLTGKITALDSYNNPTFVVVGFESKPIYCYKLKVENAKVGDTITVTAQSMKNYGGTYEFMDCTLDSLVSGSEEGGEEGGETPTPEVPAGAIVVSIADYAAANSWANSTAYDTLTAEGFTVTVSGTPVGDYGLNTGKYYTNGNNWRVYQNENPSIVITAAEGKSIVSVIITYTIAKTGILLNGSTQIASDAIVTVGANSITFTVGNTSDGVTNGNIQITAIAVVLEDTGSVTPPAHEHNFVEGKCECGAEDPNYEAHEHKYEAVVTEPTCTVDGYTTHTCACGDSYTDSEVKAAGHAEENGDYKCDNCSAVVEPKDGEVLTVAQAKKLADALGAGNYTTNKYYMTVIIENVYNTQYGNANVKDANGDKYVIYGIYSADGNTRYDALSYKPVAGDEITVYGVIGSYAKNGAIDSYQMKNGWLDEVVAHNHNYEAVVTAPTCTADGYTTHTCSICQDTYTDGETPKTGHTTENGVCGNCGKTIGGEAPAQPEVVATFDFGANGSATHADGNDLGASKSYTSGSYTLSLTDMSKVYGPAYDAMGNSCIKLGTSKLVGSFTFTVPENVTEVCIYVAQYKANATTISVNGVSYTLTKASNNGEYDVIKVDTSTTKTVTFATVASTYRAMVNTIEFVGLPA